VSIPAEPAGPRGTTVFTTVDSPVGALLATADDCGLTGLYFTPSKYPPEDDGTWRRDDVRFAAVRAQLAAYFAGELTAFDLPLAPVGTPFQMRVWRALCDIPFGETVSYGTLARRIGAASASRAVGHANGQNPISIIVPCHRVVGADGSLTGFGGGLPRKRFLLQHEAAAGFRLRA
jgi:methylated-DNA-[protein]-cysteine S-methyltransferase